MGLDSQFSTDLPESVRISSKIQEKLLIVALMLLALLDYCWNSEQLELLGAEACVTHLFYLERSFPT